MFKYQLFGDRSYFYLKEKSALEGVPTLEVDSDQERDDNREGEADVTDIDLEFAKARMDL